MNARTTSRRSSRAGARRSCRGSGGTATDPTQETDALVAALDAPSWTRVLDGVAAATTWLQSLMPGDRRAAIVIDRLVGLARHAKWEVRRSVANAAAKTLHGDFDPVLARLAADSNARVRRAAEAAILRRRHWGQASALGKQHEQHLVATLDDIEVRFGVRGRAAVRRAAEHVANTFARELYHEIVKVLSPIGTSAERLLARLEDERAPRAELVEKASEMKERIARLRSFLDAMRTYTAQPRLEFATEDLKEVVEESVAIVRDGHRSAPAITVDVAANVRAAICRSRLVQALTNLVANAVEACDDVRAVPIAIHAAAEEERVVITIVDHGCGMSEEALADATVLFTTSKPGGTGFGLPLVVKIVESEHGGRLELRSRRGEGTTARVILPRAQREPS